MPSKLYSVAPGAANAASPSASIGNGIRPLGSSPISRPHALCWHSPRSLAMCALVRHNATRSSCRWFITDTTHRPATSARWHVLSAFIGKAAMRFCWAACMQCEGCDGPHWCQSTCGRHAQHARACACAVYKVRPTILYARIMCIPNHHNASWIHTAHMPMPRPRIELGTFRSSV